MTDVIFGAAFIQWLEDQGAIPDGRPYRRVVIDASYDGPVSIYTEELGTERLIPASAQAPESLLTAHIVKLGDDAS